MVSPLPRQTNSAGVMWLCVNKTICHHVSLWHSRLLQTSTVWCMYFRHCEHKLLRVTVSVTFIFTMFHSDFLSLPVTIFRITSLSLQPVLLCLTFLLPLLSFLFCFENLNISKSKDRSWWQQPSSWWFCSSCKLLANIKSLDRQFAECCFE